jgi:hypothetical protein
MAVPSLLLVQSLRQAANNLRNGNFYAWGHHGACNCGQILQVVGNYTKEEIQAYAHTGAGEWTEIMEETCSVTGAPVSLLITKLKQLGLTNTDVHNIEYLSDREVLAALPGGFRWLNKNEREHAIMYFEAMAILLEDKLLQTINLNELFTAPVLVTAEA